MNEELKPISDSENEFANDSYIVHEPIKPIADSDSLIIKEDDKPKIESKEPENTPPLSSYIDSNNKENNTTKEETPNNIELPEEYEEETEIIEEIPVSNTTSTEKVEVPVKKKSKVKSFIKFIIFILFLVGGYFGYKYGMEYYYTNDSNATVSDLIEFDDKTKEFEINNLKFDIPDNLVVEDWTDYFNIIDDKNEFVAKVEFSDENFQRLYESYTHLIPDTTASYNGKQEIKEYNNKEYIVIPSASFLSKKLIAFTKSADDKTIIITLINKKNTYDYKLLEKLSIIINSVNDGKEEVKENKENTNK